MAGNLPDGYIWHMLVQCGDNFNIVLMEPIEDTASAVADLPEEDGKPEKKPKLIGAVLERGWVGESGKYSVQLRGVKGEEVRHTNLITIRIPKSMAGEAQWPEVPSEFTQIEHRVNETYEKVKNTAAEAEKAKNAIENMGATAKSVEPDEEASVEKTVDEDGNLDMPIIGPIQCKGKTRSELAQEIADKIREGGYISDPTVNIQFADMKISVIGEVARPGQYNITNDRISLLDALSLAGDLTIYGVRSDIKVIREENGVRTTATLDLTSQDIYDSPYFYLQQNDVVYVKPNKYRAQAGEISQNRSFYISLVSTAMSLATLIATLTR